MAADRRTALVAWARRRRALLIEDDYDAENRYDRMPVGAIQGLDPEHVVYFGTASKSVAPALRLGWAVVPQRLVAAVGEAKGRVDTVSVLDQLIFTEFLSSGSFDSHVRSRRQGNRRRREELIAAVAESAPEVRVVGMAAGLQAVLALPAGMEARTLEAAELHDLEVSGLSQFRHPQADPSHQWGDALVVNFSSISDSAWPAALRSLCDVLSGVEKWSD
jgi:GntR family transcriptional regulator/MocR family aminotransferase